jgi:aldose 1-epimerase
MKIENTKFYDMDAVSFSAGDYEALVVPCMGGNVVKLTHTAKNVELLRTPKADEVENFKTRPQVYGLPLLFPPNRIGNATYTKNGKTYKYPDVGNKFGCYVHGIIKSQPFEVTKTEINEDFVIVETTFVSDSKSNAIFKDFDHAFVCTLSNKLSANGLEQTVSFKNNSSSPMPLGVGFHTPLNVPFCSDSKPEDYRMKVSVGKRWELTEATLPTEKLLELDAFEADLRKDGIAPLSRGYEFHMTNQALDIDGHKYNGAILTDTSKNISVYYEVDNQYKHWTLWNNNADFNYTCPEPMTWAINAPNLSLPDDFTGYQEVAPSDTWSAVTKLYIL